MLDTIGLNKGPARIGKDGWRALAVAMATRMTTRQELTVAENLSQCRVATIQTPTTHTNPMLEGTRGNRKTLCAPSWWGCRLVQYQKMRMQACQKWRLWVQLDPAVPFMSCSRPKGVCEHTRETPPLHQCLLCAIASHLSSEILFNGGMHLFCSFYFLRQGFSAQYQMSLNSDPTASASQLLRLKACTTTGRLDEWIFKMCYRRTCFM